MIQFDRPARMIDYIYLLGSPRRTFPSSIETSRHTPTCCAHSPHHFGF
jgi:hypothetical protein